MCRKVEGEVVALQEMTRKEIWNGVEWRVNGQWKMMPDVDVRLKGHAELGDVVGMSASCIVGDFGPERWAACLDVSIEIWIWMNGRYVCAEIWVVDVDVEENVKDCAVVHGVHGVKRM